MISKNIFDKSGKTSRSPPPPTNRLALSPKQSSSSQAKPSSVSPKSSCKACNKLDDDEMVQCDECDTWYHYPCANVTSDIEYEDWICPKCSSNENAASQLAPQTGNVPSTSSMEKGSAVAKQLKSGIRPLSPQPSKAGSSRKPKSTGTSRSVKLSLQRLDEERLLKENRDKEYLDTKYDILEQASDVDSEIRSVSAKDRLEDWVSDQLTNVKKPSSQPDQSNKVKVDETWVGAIFPPKTDQLKHCMQPKIDTYKAADNTQVFSHYDQILPGNQTPNLSSQQLAIRRIAPKELPSFSGRPEEWPLFISCYENTTRACGCSDDENLIRLQKCLKGNALEAVRARLMYPSQVPNIISTLRRLFGRPEAIIKTLIAKLRSERPPKADRLDSLVTFALSVQNIVATMEATGLTSHLNNPCLLQELTEKLPYQTRLNWGIFKMGAQTVDLSTFSAWLDQVAQAACEVVDTITSHTVETKPEKKRTTNTSFINTHETVVNDNPRPCIICNNKCKSVEQCRHFIGLSLKHKWSEVKKHFLCRTCLIRHYNRKCTSNKNCGINGCPYKHHKLLHKSEESLNSNPENSSIGYNNCNIHQHKASLLFKVLPVTLYNKDIQVDTFAFLDDGSSITLMNQEVADILQLAGEAEPLCLKWTSNTCRMENKSRNVNLQISAVNCPKTYLLSNIRTVESLNLPTQSMNFDRLKSRFPHLKGIPVSSYYDAKPQILIGLDHSRLSNSLKHREGNIDQPVAIKTRLGWTVFGSVTGAKERTIDYVGFHMCECQDRLDEKLHEMVREFFAVENIGLKDMKRLMNRDDIRATTLLEDSTVRVGKRFRVPLLWKSEYVELPNSRPTAERRLLCLEKRLKREPILAANLRKQISDYVEKGYARKLTKDELTESRNHRTWYLPIFPVINPNKPSKVRIVWDAAARVKGISLNSMLLSGPDNLPALPEILFRFRQRKIAICGDIREMFHQIMVSEADQDAQRFLWRNEDTGVIEDYKMLVLTFGSTCSPCCAEFIKNKNASQYVSKFPRAVESITQNHYVDDFLDSVDTEREALDLANEVIYIHQQGGFEIRNFMSNSERVTLALGNKAASYEKNFETRSGLYEAEKVLGMWWSPVSDQFSFLYNTKKLNARILNGVVPPTKREVLRVLMSIFDPLGLIAHFLVLLKILLQEVWRQRIQWDEAIHPEHLELWREWVKLLPVVKEIKIRRPYLTKLNFESGSSVELHVFVDASLSAYAAVAYIRVQRRSHIECALVCSRTKVGPLKHMSVPRMELEAAVLGVRLAKTVVKGHSIQIDRRYFWSDSQSVLCWIKNDHRKVKQFVMFRVGEILENSNEDEWRWVPSEENVADDATKWNLKIDLSSESRWYHGPQFLYQPKDEWPSSTATLHMAECEFNAFTHDTLHVTPLVNYERFSSWKKLCGTMAYVYRFSDMILKKRRKEGIRGISSDDVRRAENYLYRLCQFECYPEEVSLLKRNLDATQEISTVERSSSLYRLSPYLDQNGVMRIKGRIDASIDASFDCKRPIILPKAHYITMLIVRDYHQRYRHLYFETVINELRQIYYIPTLRMVLRRVQSACQRCKNRRVVPAPPLMAELPPARLKSFTRPFSYVGMDYFGPMLVTVGRRTEKRWGVILTCLTIRAIHIEIAHSLSSDSCILAIQRFCAKRGRPLEIWSDNGTNFRGASKELKETLEQLNIDKVAGRFVGHQIKWNFIPPASPHMGGSWERLVRSVKQTLANIQISRQPRDELLMTMMSEVEYIINSRPLTYVPLDEDSDEALTPNHFLMGSSSGMRLTGQLRDDGAVLRKNWLTSEMYADLFWRRWVKEYLPSLTRRTKWFKPAKPLSEGDLVIIVDPNNQRSTWPMGKVIQVHRSKDGQTRSAMIQTATGVYTRPTAKLAVMDVNRFGDVGNPDDTPSLPGGSVAKPGNADLTKS